MMTKPRILTELRPHGMTVLEGRRMIAKARPIRERGWLLRRYGADWDHPLAGVEQEGSANSMFGEVDRSRIVVKTRKQAIEIMQELVDA